MSKKLISVRKMDSNKLMKDCTDEELYCILKNNEVISIELLARTCSEVLRRMIKKEMELH